MNKKFIKLNLLIDKEANFIHDSFMISLQF